MDLHGQPLLPDLLAGGRGRHLPRTGGQPEAGFASLPDLRPRGADRDRGRTAGSGIAFGQALASASQALPAVMRTALLGLFSMGKINAAASAVPVLLSPMIAAHWRCSSGRLR